MYSVIGGLELDPNLPGYKHIIFHPQPGGGLTYAAIEYQSQYGMIRSAWTLKNQCFEWHVSVPANTTATATLPAIKISHVMEGGKPFQEAEGGTLLDVVSQGVVFRLGSGNYHFTSLLI